VDGLRVSLSGAGHFGLTVDFAVLAILSSIILIVGTRLFSKIQL
jgi:hypothetical protein